MSIGYTPYLHLSLNGSAEDNRNWQILDQKALDLARNLIANIPAGGDLTGFYPDPLIREGVVTGAKLSPPPTGTGMTIRSTGPGTFEWVPALTTDTNWKDSGTRLEPTKLPNYPFRAGSSTFIPYVTPGAEVNLLRPTLPSLGQSIGSLLFCAGTETPTAPIAASVSAFPTQNWTQGAAQGTMLVFRATRDSTSTPYNHTILMQDGTVRVTVDPFDPLDLATKRYVDAKPTGIPEAPTDGQQYARQNAGWSVVVSSGSGLWIDDSGPSMLVPAIAGYGVALTAMGDGLVIRHSNYPTVDRRTGLDADDNSLFVHGGAAGIMFKTHDSTAILANMTAAVTTFSMPVAVPEIQFSTRLDIRDPAASTYLTLTTDRVGVFWTTPQERLHVAGGLVLGAATNPTPVNGTLQWTGTKFQGRVGGAWVDIPGAGGGGIPDAPSDGQTYGRNNAAWTVVTGGGGGETLWQLDPAFDSGNGSYKPVSAHQFASLQLWSGARLAFNGLGESNAPAVSGGGGTQLRLYGGAGGIVFRNVADEVQWGSLDGTGYLQRGNIIRFGIATAAFGQLDWNSTGAAGAGGVYLRANDPWAPGDPAKPSWALQLDTQTSDQVVFYRRAAGGGAGATTNMLRILATGEIRGGADPTVPLGLATKQYVDGKLTTADVPVGPSSPFMHLVTPSGSNVSFLTFNWKWTGSAWTQDNAGLGSTWLRLDQNTFEFARANAGTPGSGIVVARFESSGRMTLPGPTTAEVTDQAAVVFGTRGIKGRLTAAPSADYLHLAFNSRYNGSSYTQDDAAKPSWLLVCDVTNDNMTFLHGVAGGQPVASLLKVDGAGKLTIPGPSGATDQAQLQLGSRTAKGRIQSLPGLNWFGLAYNGWYNGTAWNADDTAQAVWQFNCGSGDTFAVSRALGTAPNTVTTLLNLDVPSSSGASTCTLASPGRLAKTRLIAQGNADVAYLTCNAALTAGPWTQDDTSKSSWIVAPTPASDNFQIQRIPAGGTSGATILALDSAGTLILGLAGSTVTTVFNIGLSSWWYNNGLWSGSQPDPTKSSWGVNMNSQSDNWTINRRAPGGPAGGFVFLTVDIVGNLTISGGTAVKASGTTWANPSDRRLKENIEDYPTGLAAVCQLQPRAFIFNGKGGSVAGMRGYGFIADEVMGVMDDMVGSRTGKLNEDDEQDTEISTLDQSNLILALVNSVKELAARVAALEAT